MPEVRARGSAGLCPSADQSGPSDLLDGVPRGLRPRRDGTPHACLAISLLREIGEPPEPFGQVVDMSLLRRRIAAAMGRYQPGKDHGVGTISSVTPSRSRVPLPQRFFAPLPPPRLFQWIRS